MGRKRPNKRNIVDAIIAGATEGLFTGDERDGLPPLIAPQNVHTEMLRYIAQAWRTQLMRLTLPALHAELNASNEFAAALKEHLKNALAQLERNERDAHIRARNERQSELAKRSRLQPDIVAAARRYREQELTAGKAWDEIYKTPFRTADGSIVKIDGPKGHRLEQQMRVISRDERQLKRAIKWDQWRQVYWKSAAKPG
jgi:hypothetical protein